MSDAHAPVESVAEEPDYFEVLVESLRDLLVAKGPHRRRRGSPVTR